MTPYYFLLAGAVIFLLSVIWLRITDALDARKLARCVAIIGSSKCPQCGHTIGFETASGATQKSLKFVDRENKRMRGRDYPSRLLVVDCSNCSARLQFRFDGSLFSYDGRVIS